MARPRPGFGARSCKTVTPHLVVSNSAQHLQTALALKEGGRPVRLVGPLLHPFPSGASWLPSGVRHRLSERQHRGLSLTEVRSLWPVEVAANLGRRLAVMTPEQALTLTVNLFDWAAWPDATRCRTFHFHAGLGLRAAHTARRRGAPLICDERGPHVLTFERLARRELGGEARDVPRDACTRNSLQAYSECDAIFVSSEAARRTFLEEGISPEKVVVARYGAPDWPRRPEQEPDRTGARRPRVLFVGRLTPLKGLRYLFEAFRQLHAPDVELVLVGPADEVGERWVKDACARDSRITWLGPRDKHALSEIYRSATVLVLPTLFDSFGFVVFEAIAEGLPVIVTSEAGASESLEDGKSALIVPARSADALATAMRRALEDEQLRVTMAREAREVLVTRTWARYREDVRRNYDRLGY